MIQRPIRKPGKVSHSNLPPNETLRLGDVDDPVLLGRLERHQPAKRDPIPDKLCARHRIAQQHNTERHQQDTMQRSRSNVSHYSHSRARKMDGLLTL